MPSPNLLRRLRARQLQILRIRLWERSWQYDGIPNPGRSALVFSQGNPALPLYERACRLSASESALPRRPLPR